MPRLDIDEMLNAELETKYNKVEVPKDTNPFEKAKQTNADRIRSMTDEELAEFIFSQVQAKCSNHDCVGADFCYYHADWNGACGSGCEHAIIKWLQKDSEV